MTTNLYETGFFGALVGSVKDLGLYNVQVDADFTYAAGGLAGRSFYANDETGEPCTISGVYVTGTVKASTPSTGALVGEVRKPVTITNCYTNAAILNRDGTRGDMIGDVYGYPDNTTIRNSYSAGKVNGSEANAISGTINIHKENALFYNGTNQEEICNTVSQWDGWNENGTVGNGWPLLQWQVERGDYLKFCGFARRGDVNLDGRTDIADAVTVLNAMAGEQVAGDADVNGDQKVDIADFVTVLNIMAGL